MGSLITPRSSYITGHSMAGPGQTVDVDRLAAERDLYRELLALSSCDEPQVFFAEITHLLGRFTGAGTVLIGVFEGDRLLWSSHRGAGGPSERQILDHLSTGVLQECLASGKTIQTSSAMLDARFLGRESVRRNQIEAVLCLPHTLEAGRTVVVYVQRTAGQGPFPADLVDDMQGIVSRLGAVGRSALAKADDPTARARERLLNCGFIGRSGAVASLLDQVATVAPLDIDVLLTGATGTGKSMLAQTLHANSSRRDGPLISVNCPSVVESLFEAEFFGAVAGAYTGATHTRDGFVQAAAGGTLFLDEVADLSLTTQSKLLQLLQERTFTRVGDATSRRANVRVVAATHTDLDAAVAQGRFRADLRYRLEVVPMRVPSLHERRADIPLLLQHFFDAARQRHSLLADLQLSPATLRAAHQAEWPGNVRQLAHAVEAALIRAHARRCSTVEPADLLPNQPKNATPTWQTATRAFQRELLRETLETVGGNVSEAARRLDIARSHAYELLKALEIER